MRIAVPVDSDKETIFKRVGQAPFFAIYQDNQVVEYIPNSHGHLHHDEHEHGDDHEEHTKAHKKDTAGISNCDVILVQMIGEHMREAIESHNIKIQKIRQKDGTTSNEAVANFLNNNL